VLVGIVEVGDGGADVGRAAGLEVSGDGGQLVCIARDEK
jgi:hypothetical protein